MNAESGALRLVPGSHRPSAHDELGARAEEAARRADAWPSVVFESRPGDAVVFDVRVWHGSFNGALRVAGSVNYRIDPRTEQELAACRDYFARSHHHVGQRYGGVLALYPEYFRSLPDPHHRRWVRRMDELGVLDAGPAGVPETSSKEISR